VNTDELKTGMAQENEEQKQTTNPEAQSGDVIGKYADENEYKAAYDTAMAKINEWKAFAEESTDWKNIRSQQVDLRSEIKALFLKKEDAKQLNEVIDEIAGEVNNRQNAEREEKEKVYNENNDKYVAIVNEKCEQAKNADLFSKARDLLTALQTELRNVQLKRSQRDNFFSQIQTTFSELNEKRATERENYEMECIDNYLSLKKEIEAACAFADETEIFNDARQKLIEVQRNIKGKKLKRSQRDELYQIIRDHFEALNDRQAKEREVSDEEAGANFEKLNLIVDEAIAFAKSTEEYGESRARLIAAQKEIKSMKLKRAQRDELYARIREVFTSLNDQQAAEREQFEGEAKINYDKLSEKVNEAFELVLGVTDFRLIRETLMNVQAEVRLMKLKRNQRNELFARIREAFGIFDKKRDEYYSERRDEKKKKLMMVIDNLNAKVSRTKELIQKDLDILKVLKKQDDAEEEQITAVERKINDRNNSMEDLQKRIEEVNKEITDLDKPEAEPVEEKAEEVNA
jgi:hypothetical protein